MSFLFWFAISHNSSIILNHLLFSPSTYSFKLFYVSLLRFFLMLILAHIFSFMEGLRNIHSLIYSFSGLFIFLYSFICICYSFLSWACFLTFSYTPSITYSLIQLLWLSVAYTILSLLVTVQCIWPWLQYKVYAALQVNSSKQNIMYVNGYMLSFIRFFIVSFMHAWLQNITLEPHS